MSGFLRRQDFAAIADATLASFVNDPSGDPMTRMVRVTSGTTGAPLVSMLEYVPEPERAKEWYGGAHRIVQCQGALNSRLFNILPLVRYGEPGVRILSLDTADLTPEFSAEVVRFAPDRIAGFPSMIARLAPLLDDETRAGVLSIKMAGEILTQQLGDFFASKFPNAMISMVYAASETGLLSKPSKPSCPRNHYHPREDAGIEIVEADADGVGDIAVSKTLFRDIRIERYLVGDSGQFVGPCTCGETVTLRLLGRTGYDYLKLAGALLRREEFDRIAGHYPHVIHDYRVEARTRISDSLQGFVSLEIFSLQPVSKGLTEEIRDRFEREMYVTPTRTYRDLVDDGIFLPLTLRVSQSPFPKGHKDVKMAFIE